MIVIARFALVGSLLLGAGCAATATTTQSSADSLSTRSGVPANDPDLDGVLGAADRCPTQAEDLDHVADSDGCPEVDQDCDAIADRADVCPERAEDRDGWQDEDGCPDEDNDGDRLVDRCDTCPNEPETLNGFRDADGCPDSARVLIQQSEIRIVPAVYFRRGASTTRPESVAVLDAVARTLAAHPEITAVEVVGHASTDERDPVGIGRRRAEAAQAWLVQHGVEAARLSVRSEGSARPVDAGTTAAARERNRRVNFEIARSAQPEPSPEPPVMVCPPVAEVASVAGGCPMPSR